MRLVSERGTNDLASVKEASEELRIPAPTIYRWIQEGLLKTHRRKVRRTRIFVSKADILKLLEPRRGNK
jgi:excisionase family DNA binding protein